MHQSPGRLLRRTSVQRPGLQERLGLSRRQLLVVLAAALAVRVGYVLLVLPHYSFHADDGHYSEIAANVAHGHGVSAVFPYLWLHHTAFRPPLYPLLLGATYAVLGVHVGVAQALNVVLGSFVVVLAAVVAGRLGGRRAAVVAAVVAGLHPSLLANDGVALTEPLALLLLLVGVLMVVDGRWIPAGIALGLLVLTRPSAQLLVPTVAVLLVLQRRWRPAIAVALAAAVVVAPWVVRNEVYFGKPVIVTSNGFNLAAIWSDQAIAAGHFVDPIRDPAFAALHDYGHSYANLNEANLDATFQKAGLEGLRTHKRRIPSQVRDNVLFLADVSWQRNDDAERLDGRNLSFRHATLPVVWVLEALGLVALLRLIRRRAALLLPIGAAYFVAVALVTVSPPRLRAPADVLSCVAIGLLVASVPWRRRKADEPQTDSRVRAPEPAPAL